MDHERGQPQNKVIAGEDPDKMNEEDVSHAREPEMTNTDVFFTKPVDESTASNMFKQVSVELKKSELGQLNNDHNQEEQKQPASIQLNNQRVHSEQKDQNQQPDTFNFALQQAPKSESQTKLIRDTQMVSSTIVNVNLNDKWQ